MGLDPYYPFATILWFGFIHRDEGILRQVVPGTDFSPASAHFHRRIATIEL
jgi:hypothetical protein